MWAEAHRQKVQQVSVYFPVLSGSWGRGCEGRQALSLSPPWVFLDLLLYLRKYTMQMKNIWAGCLSEHPGPQLHKLLMCLSFGTEALEQMLPASVHSQVALGSCGMSDAEGRQTACICGLPFLLPGL